MTYMRILQTALILTPDFLKTLLKSIKTVFYKRNFSICAHVCDQIKESFIYFEFIP
jgi:hypothetical protein